MKKDKLQPKKARFFQLHPECNPGKIVTLEAVHTEYFKYANLCAASMLDSHVLTMPRTAKQDFFPPAENLTSQIEKNARDQAITLVSSWAKSVYVRTLKNKIWLLFKNKEITEDFKYQLCIVGKHLVTRSTKSVSQEAINTYLSWLYDEEISGKKPSFSARAGMLLTQETATFRNPKHAWYPGFWVSVSTLDPGNTVKLPLARNQYILRAKDVSKGILVRKTRKGVWRFEAIAQHEFEIPEITESTKYVGIDVGLNVIAATSEGLTLGEDLKPLYDLRYAKIQEIRANRRRQGLYENSPRLDRLETKLSSLTKTAVGTVANKLIKIYPNTCFVVEDLDLRGCKGSKRYCYHALAKALEVKAPIEKVNPAYSSQTCPSCTHVSRSNRRGVDFCCRQCSRKSHADVVGAINLLRRSKAKQANCDIKLRITLEHHKSEVKGVLAKLYWKRRHKDLPFIFQDCPPDFLRKYAPIPKGQRLTVKKSGDICTASNQMLPDCSKVGQKGIL